MSERNAGTKGVREFTFMSFLLRFLMSLALVLITYNPTQYSVFHWVHGAWTGSGLGPEHYFVMVLLLIGWSILWFSTWRALDTYGVLLAVALVGTFVWLLVSKGLITPDSTSGYVWLGLVCLAVVLAIGLSWSSIWRRMTGQVAVDEIET